MSDLLKVKVGGSDYLCKWTDPRYVVVGGIKYKAKKYGTKLWTLESLRNTTSNSYKPNGTDQYGLLYPYNNFSSITALLPEGWRIPTKADFDDLISICGSTGSDYMSTDFGGTNTNGFNACLTGYVNQSGQFKNYNVRGYIWSNTEYTNSYYMWNAYYDSSLFADTDYSNKSTTKLQIRICKDVS